MKTINKVLQGLAFSLAVVVVLAVGGFAVAKLEANRVNWTSGSAVKFISMVASDGSFQHRNAAGLPLVYVSSTTVGFGTTAPAGTSKVQVQDGVLVSSRTSGFGQITVHGSSGGCLMLRSSDSATVYIQVMANSAGVVSGAVEGSDGMCD